MAKIAYPLFLCLFSVTFICGDKVPVLLFGKALPFSVPALQTLKTDEFTNLVQSQMNDETVTVVFVEPKLSVEDLSQCKSDDGITCFKALASFKERTYLPNVVDAVNGLYDNLESNKATIDQSDDILEAVEEGNRVIFVYLEVASNSKDYESHDKIIADIFAKLSQKYKNIVAIYTGEQSSLESHSLSRNKRQATGDEKPKVAGAEKPKNRNGAINKGEPKHCNNFIITAEKIVERASGENAPETSNDLATCSSTLANKVLTVTLQPSDLSLKFKQVAGTWSLFGAEKPGKKYSYPTYVYANKGFAYRCGGSFTFADGTGALIKLKNFQFMPDFEKADNTKFYKDQYVYSEGFWSPGILAGLFVVFIFIFILLVGLTWIMDINTMDKFDDPKGKTIIINTSE